LVVTMPELFVAIEAKSQADDILPSRTSTDAWQGRPSTLSP
jgi:hypothetical protein